MRRLIIRDPWIDLILSGKKTWEIRGSKTKVRGEIALIRSGSGMVYGTCKLVNVIGPISLRQMRMQFERHRVPLENLKGGLPYKNTYAWVMEDARRLKDPIPYKHPQGAVIWVKLPDSLFGNIPLIR